MKQPTAKPALGFGEGKAAARRLESVRQISLPQRIAEAIIEAAADGKFRLGERLVEPDLAKDLNVSRVPVREALRILESQGIVVASPNHGMRLMTMDPERLDQLLIVRASLERLAVSTLMRQIDQDWQTDLAQALLDMKVACDVADARKVAMSDLAFHRTLMVRADNWLALEFWGNIAKRLRVIMGLAARSRAGARRTDFQSYYEYHVSLFNILMSGDEARAIEAIGDHILESEQWDPVRAASLAASVGS